MGLAPCGQTGCPEAGAMNTPVNAVLLVGAQAV